MIIKIALLLLACILKISLSEGVIYGEKAKPGEFPFMVGFMIKQYNILNCGGAIVSSRLIATTAHCICHNWSYKYYYVVVGTTNLRRVRYRYELIQSICYEDFDPDSLTHDLGLAKTLKPFEFNSEVQLIALNTEAILPGDYVIATGWGCTDRREEDFPDILRYNSLLVIPEDECLAVFWTLPNIQLICTATTPTSGMCAGDSGGPIMFDGRLAGISYGGAPNAPDLFVKISSFIPWINRQILFHNRNEFGYFYDDSKIINNYSRRYDNWQSTMQQYFARTANITYDDFKNTNRPYRGKRKIKPNDNLIISEQNFDERMIEKIYKLKLN